MTTQDKPAVGPLSADDVKLLVKGDLLRVIDPRAVLDLDAVETFDCEGHPDSFIKLMCKASHFRATRFAFIGRPGPDGWIAWSGGEKAPLSGPRIEVRSRWYPDEVIEDCNPDNVHWPDVIAFRLAPTAPVETAPGHTDLMVSPESLDAFLEANPPPVEALGETKGPGGYLVKDFADGWYWTPNAALEEISGAPVWSVEHSRYETALTQPDIGKVEAGWVEREALIAIMREHIEIGGYGSCSVEIVGFEEAADAVLALRPQPSGETREAVARVEAMLPAIERIFPVHVTETPDYAELAFHECAAQAMTMEPDTWTALNTLATDLRALLLPAEQGGGDDLRATCQAILDDHQTSETHHPDHILIRRADFERIAALIRSAIPASEGGEG